MGHTHRSLPSSWWKARNGRFLRSGKLWHSVISHNCQPIICGLLRGVIKWFICQSRRYGISEQQMVNRNGIRWRRVVLGVFDFLFDVLKLAASFMEDYLSTVTCIMLFYISYITNMYIYIHIIITYDMMCYYVILFYSILQIVLSYYLIVSYFIILF